MDSCYDVAVIGGGINGCGCAADAALRGLSVFLCEQDEIAAHTSSNSSKMIHGGLRYLEQKQFRLVKKALDERQTLLNIAGHLINPLPILIPLMPQMRQRWQLRLGLFLYDNLTKHNKLPHTEYVTAGTNPDLFAPLKLSLKNGYVYYDCITNDKALTEAIAQQAKMHGAHIATHTKLIRAATKQNIWHLTLENFDQSLSCIRAKVLINATGPWVESTNKFLQMPMQYKISLVKGSHIVVPQLYSGHHGYLLQHLDKRIIFILPYQENTLIGTTDIPYFDSPAAVKISDAEIDYLLEITNLYFKVSLQKATILQTFSGVRTLLSNPAKKAADLSREYIYHLISTPAPAITIYSGKITTYRRLAAAVIDNCATFLPNLPPSRSDQVPLP